jgi:hypothetical protein
MINAHAQASWPWSLDQGGGGGSSKLGSSSEQTASDGVLQQRPLLLFPILGEYMHASGDVLESY